MNIRVSKLRFDSIDLAKSFPLDVKRVALRWRRFSQPLSKTPKKIRIDFTGLISSSYSRSPGLRSYSAPTTHQVNLRICAKLLTTLSGEVAERLNAAVC